MADVASRKNAGNLIGRHPCQVQSVKLCLDPNERISSSRVNTGNDLKLDHVTNYRSLQYVGDHTSADSQPTIS